MRLAWGCFLAVATVLSACGGGSTADTTIRIGIGADRYLTELPSRPDLGKYPLNAGVFDTLVRMTESLDIEPMLRNAGPTPAKPTPGGSCCGVESCFTTDAN